MRYVGYRFFSIALLILFGISSCDEKATEQTSPPVILPIFPMSVGNYWIYDTYDLRADGSRIDESYRSDSVVIESIVNISEKDAYKFVRYTDGVVTKTEYYREEYSRIFRLTETDTFNLFFPDNFDIMTTEPKYATVYDPFNNVWVAARDIVTSSIEYLDSRFEEKQVYSCEVSSVVTCEFEYAGTVDISDKTYNSSVYSLYPDMTINVQNFKRFVNSEVSEVAARVFISSYDKSKKIVINTYVENIGLANIRHEPYQVNYYSIDDGSENTVIRDKKYFNGINRKLVRFFISDEN